MAYKGKEIIVENEAFAYFSKLLYLTFPHENGDFALRKPYQDGKKRGVGEKETALRLCERKFNLCSFENMNLGLFEV